MSLASDYFHYGALTANANTAIVRTIAPRKNRFPQITMIRYTAAGTAHTVTIMEALGSTTVNGAALAAQATVTLTADPGPAGNGIAANDYLVFALPDGTYLTDTVSAWNSTTKVVTLANNLPTGGIATGATCWFFGVVGDHTDDQQAAPASTVSIWSQDTGCVRGSTMAGSPMIVHSNNATAAGTLGMVLGRYSNRP